MGVPLLLASSGDGVEDWFRGQQPEVGIVDCPCCHLGLICPNLQSQKVPPRGWGEGVPGSLGEGLVTLLGLAPPPPLLVQACAVAPLGSCLGVCGPGRHEQPGARAELCAPVGSREESLPFLGPLMRPVWLPQGGTERNLASPGRGCRWLGLQGPPGSSGEVVSGSKWSRPGAGRCAEVERCGPTPPPGCLELAMVTAEKPRHQRAGPLHCAAGGKEKVRP